MKNKKNILGFLIFISILSFNSFINISSSTASSCPFGGSPNWQGVCDTTTDSGQEYHGPTMTVEQAKTHTENNLSENKLQTSANNELSTENKDISSTWVVVDKNKVIENIIVCTESVCGNNNFHNKEVYKSPPGTHSIGTIKNQDFSWNIKKSICHDVPNQHICSEATYKIYDNGNSECIQNCSLPNVQDYYENISRNNDIIENNQNLIIENNQDDPILVYENTEEELTPVIFSTKLKSNTLITIVATNKNKTKIWKTKVNKNNKIKINVHKKYKKWQFKVKVRS